MGDGDSLPYKGNPMEGICGWCALGAGAGIIFITPEGIKLEHSFRLGFKAFNNDTKYEALLV